MPIRRIPSLNWLRVFEAAARTESFTGAARILGMSPAAVSQQVKALETHLRARLFERTARNVSLTEAGAAFLPVVRQSLLSMETTAASLFGQEREAAVTIQATLIFATSWLADRLPCFGARHPAIQLHVMAGDTDPPISRDGADLHVVFGSPPRSWGESEPLFGETIYPVARHDIAATIRNRFDVLNHRLIEISTHRTGWLRLLEEAGVADIEDARFCYANTTEIALAIATAGYGIALARAPATDARIAQCGLQRCWEAIEVEGGERYHLVYRSPASLSPAAQTVRNWIVEAAQP